MASDPSNTNITHYSPPRKKKKSKMVETRESLGEFESSIFDASDGHKLVDLIRRKKGIHAQAQKIFDDVPSQRPSLQIEIERLDEQNESLQPVTLPQETDPATVVNSEVPANIELVLKSPVRKSVGRSITSPIIKMNSTTLGRRTLLKEFEKAFLHESRFLPEICSTPIVCDMANEINHTQNDSAKEPCISEKESPEENISCTPITISDEGSPVEPTLSKNTPIISESCNKETMMRSLIKQNELLNALVQQSKEESDATFVNRNNLLTKSPRRTFTVQRDISTGTITLSPAKSGQNTERGRNAFIRKLNATPEQRKVLFNKFGLGLNKDSSTKNCQESPQKSSRIPILSKPATASETPHLKSQDSTTAEFVERLQKNATPNCPVIVIPVNQTFNQAPINRTITNELCSPPLNEITSTISDSTPKGTDYPSRNKNTHREPTRVDSPVSNAISSTTISNSEQPSKSKVPEPPTNNLRWDDIITDDASSSNNSDCSHRTSGLKNERRKLSKTKNSHKQQSVTNEKNKSSLSYQCLDLRLRVDSDEECENNLPQKSQQQQFRRQVSRLRDQFDEEREQNLTQRLHREDSKVEEQRNKEHSNNLQQRSRRRASNVDEQFDEDCENVFSLRYQQRNSRIAKKCDEEQEKNSPHRSRREASKVDGQCNQEHTNNLQQRSRREVSKIVEQFDEDSEPYLHEKCRKEESRIAEQGGDEEPSRNLPRPSRREASKAIDQNYERRENHLQQRAGRAASKIDKQGVEYCEHDLSKRSRRGASKYDEEREQNFTHNSRREAPNYHEQSEEELEYNMPGLRATKTSKKCDEDSEQNIRNQSSPATSEIDREREEECRQKLPQRSRREDSEFGEQRGKKREQNLQLPSRGETLNIVEPFGEKNANYPSQRSHRLTSASNAECDENNEPNFSQRLRLEPSEIDEQQHKQGEIILPQRSRSKTSKIDNQRSDKNETNLIRRSSKLSNKKNENTLQLQSQQKTSNMVEEECDQQIEDSLPQRSQPDVSKIDEQLTQLRHTINDNNDELESFQKLPPPIEFRDINSNSQRTNSIYLEKDLVDEISSDRVVLDAFKHRPKITNKKTRKPKIIPKNVKEYLEVNQKVAKTQYLNVSKRKLYSKGASDIESSDDSSLSVKSKKADSITTPQKVPRRSRKSASHRNVDSNIENVFRQESGLTSYPKPPSLSLTKSRNSYRQVAECSSKAIENEVNHIEFNQMHISRSLQKSIRSSSSLNKENSSPSKEQSANVNNNEDEGNVDKNISVRSSRSRTRTSNTAKNSRQINKNNQKYNNQGVENNVENNNLVAEHTTRSQLFLRRSSGRSPDNKKNSKQSNRLSTREIQSDVESNKERNISGRSSRSRSPCKTSTTRTSNIVKNSKKTNQIKNKVIHKNIERNPEEETSVPPPKSPSYSKKGGTSPVKAIKSSKQTNVPLATMVFNGEGNLEKDTPAPPSKSDSKKKNSKKINEDRTSTASTSMENPDCGPRRSKREKKQPTAYWACSGSKYTHVYDIYNMLTQGKKPYFPEYLMNSKSKKKDKTKLPSTDDNLVVNTNTVDSSSNKNINKKKQQSKRKIKPKAQKNMEFQSDSENELRRPNVSSESTSKSSQLSEPVSSVSSLEKTSSRVRSKQKTKEKLNLANAHNAEQDTNSIIQTSTSSSNGLLSTGSCMTNNFIQPSHSKAMHTPREIDPSSSDCPSEEDDISNVRKRRLTTIPENAQMVLNNQPKSSVVMMDNSLKSSSRLMPPPKTNVVKKVRTTSRNNTFRTEHDESIADVSSVHVNNLFDQLKNSSLNNTMVNRSRLAVNSSGQVSLDNCSIKKRNLSNSAGKTKNVSVRLQRLNFQHDGPYDTNERNFDSGFSSEDMNSINTKKDILLDWLVQMLNNGKTPSNKQKGLARFVQQNGFISANADELTFEEIDGVDFAFYNSPGQKFGYMRFKPRTQKKNSCAKRYELNFVLLGGTIQMTVDRQTFDMKNGDLTTIFIGTSYHMRNITDDPALVMVIRK